MRQLDGGVQLVAKPPRYALYAVGGALAALGYAIGIEPTWIETVHWEVFAPRLPKEFEGFTIYQVSDLHTVKFGPREKRTAAILERLPEPDLLVLTGDMIHTRCGIEPFMRLVKSMRARHGIYAVFGNSEYKNGIRRFDFAARMQEEGVTTLINQHAILEQGGAEIVLAGVEDPWSYEDDLDLAITGVPDDTFKLLLMHAPDAVGDAVHRGIDLVLSGHTHGGQVRIPLLGAPFTHSVVGRRLSSGHYHGNRLRSVVGVRPGRTQLYITRGLGISGLALRFYCRPEFTILTLRRGFPDARRAPVPR